MKLVLLALLYVISTTLSALPHTKTALDFINNEMQEVLEGSEGFLKDPVFPLSKTYDSLSESHEDAVLYFSKKHLNTVKRNEGKGRIETEKPRLCKLSYSYSKTTCPLWTSRGRSITGIWKVNKTLCLKICSNKH